MEARSIYRIGPTAPGRIRRVFVNVNDRVRPGQWIAEMERPDLDALSTSAEIEFLRQAAAVIGDTSAVSSQSAVLPSANLRLLSPVHGLVVSRNAEPGTTVVAGQPVLEIIEPQALWITTRFDQASSSGIRTGLSARVELRSRPGTVFSGRIVRVEPLADPVTQETVAKIGFDDLPATLPPLGELAEVTVALPALHSMPVVPNAALVRIDGLLGVWTVQNGSPHFQPVRTGAADLDGRVQIIKGLNEGDIVVHHASSNLSARSRIRIVESLAGGQP